MHKWLKLGKLVFWGDDDMEFHETKLDFSF